MKNALLFFSVLLLRAPILGQSTDQENLEKYWQYRDRYRQQFTKIGSEQGESLPLKSRQYQSDQSNMVDDGNGNMVPAYSIGGNLQNGNAFRIWDNTIEHGYYLMMLASEYELLRRDDQDLTALAAPDLIDKLSTSPEGASHPHIQHQFLSCTDEFTE